MEAIRDEVAKTICVRLTKVVLEQASKNWLASKYGLNTSTLLEHRVNLAAAMDQLDCVKVQKLAKRQVDDLVTSLRPQRIRAPPVTGRSHLSKSIPIDFEPGCLD